MVALWTVILVVSLTVTAALALLARRRGGSARRILLSRALPLGVPVAISLDHLLSGSEYAGKVALAALLIALSMGLAFIPSKVA